MSNSSFSLFFFFFCYHFSIESILNETFLNIFHQQIWNGHMDMNEFTNSSFFCDLYEIKWLIWTTTEEWNKWQDINKDCSALLTSLSSSSLKSPKWSSQGISEKSEMKFDFAFINHWDLGMVPIFLKCSWMQFNGQEDNLDRGFKELVFSYVLMSIDISNLFRSLKFWSFWLVTLMHCSQI